MRCKSAENELCFMTHTYLTINLKAFISIKRYRFENKSCLF